VFWCLCSNLQRQFVYFLAILRGEPGKPALGHGGLLSLRTRHAHHLLLVRSYRTSRRAHAHVHSHAHVHVHAHTHLLSVLHLVLEVLEVLKSRLCSRRRTGSHTPAHLCKKSGIRIVHEHLLRLGRLSRLGSLGSLHVHDILKIRLVALTFPVKLGSSILNVPIVFFLL